MMNPRLRADDDGLILVSDVSVSAVLGSLDVCCGVPRSRNSVFDGFRASRFDDIQSDID